MTDGQLSLTAVVGVAAGMLNYAAASGSVIAVLVLCWFGVPMLAASATVLAATPASFLRSLWEIKNVPRIMIIPLLFSGVASVAGAFIVASMITADEFRAAAPYVLIVSVVPLLSFRRVRKRIDDKPRRERFSPRGTSVILTTGFAATSMYAGAFGASVGVMILSIGSAATSWPWDRINLVKNVLCLVTSLASFGVYASEGLVMWPAWAILAVTMVIGSLIGKTISDHLPAQALRVLVAIVTTVAAGALVWTS